MIIGNRERESAPTTFTISKATEPSDGVLPSAEFATKNDLKDYVKKVPVPENLKIATPVVGEGVSLITPSNVMNVRYMHTPGPYDNFLLVFVSWMIPNAVPGVISLNTQISYGGKPSTFFEEYNSASVAADRTRGTIRGYWQSITPDPSQKPQEVVITCTTGMDLTGRADAQTYAFRSNSVSISNRTTSSHVGGDGAGSASLGPFGAAGFNRRWIGFAHVPTAPSRTFVNTTYGPAPVLWEVDDSGGRRVMIWTTTDEHTVVHGGQPANAYSSASLVVNVTAPPKVI
jgi:hypothetical protein